MLKIKDINTLKQIIKMIVSGEIPNAVYDKYLSNCPIGFMNEEDLFNQIAEENQEKDKEIERLNNIIDELKDDSRVLKEFSAWIVNRHEPDLFHKMEIVNKISNLKEGMSDE